MNTLHPNLQFTLERSVDRKLSFLDTEVKQISNQLHTNVYRKATGTGLIMHYNSICPKSSKLGLINFYLAKRLVYAQILPLLKINLQKLKTYYLIISIQKTL